MKLRIEKAKELLQNETSVLDVCIAVGFESVTSFTALFRRYTATTPADYQQRYKKRKELIRAAPLQFIPNCFARQNGWTEKSNFQELV
jgi:AraC-like DNA-binding protein